jgi:putative tryptophan/tyrosine transport system substrate-binding protein
MRRRDFITTLGGAAATAAWPLAARAQQAAKALQVGFLYPGPQAAAVPRMAAYLSGLQAGGFRAEESTLIPRVTAGNSTLLAPMATELVASNVNLIMAVGPAAVRAAQAATSTIPIVANDLESDPVSSGFVASTARPGGNITGMFLDFPDFSKKWLEALKEGVPQLSNVAVLWDPATGPTQRNAIDAAARALGLSLAIVEIRERADFETAFQSATQQHVGGAVILSSPLVGANTKLLAELAGKYSLPAVTLFPDFARAGGLMAYGPDLLGMFKQIGIMSAKILRGAKPGELPIESPSKFEFVLNLKTAHLLGLTMPTSILLRADEVIE